MRKTLEIKKDINKNCDKTPIESKSVSDFKVPKIPIKKIHDIYKSSDLLPPQSNLIADNYEDNIAQSAKLLRNRYNDREIMKHSNFQDTNENNQETENAKVFNEDTSNKSCQSSNSEFNNEARSNSPKILTSSSENTLFVQEITKNSQNSHKSKVNTISLLNQLTDTNIEKDNLSTNVKYSDSVENDVPTICSENLSFAKKLDSLGANGKNLNDDISVLESDLKTLSEMMFQINNKKSVNKLPIKNINVYCEKKSFDDLTENLQSLESLRETNRTLSTSPVFERIEFNDDADSINEVEDIASNDEKIDVENRAKIVVENKAKIVMENKAKIDVENKAKIDMENKAKIDMEDKVKKIDFKAKSKEILNEIEKSIICEHMKSLDIQAQTFEKGSSNLHKESEISSDLNSIEENTESISEILSKTESKSVSENVYEISKSLKEIDSLNKFTKNETQFKILQKYKNADIEKNKENFVSSIEIQEKSIGDSSVMEHEKEGKLNEQLTSLEASDIDFTSQKDLSIADSLELSKGKRRQTIDSKEIENSQSAKDENTESDSLLNIGDELNIEEIATNREKELSDNLNSSEIISTERNCQNELNSASSKIEQNLSPNDEIWFDEKSCDLLSSTKKDDFSPSIPVKSNSSQINVQSNKSSHLKNVCLSEEEDDMGESIRKLFSDQFSIATEPQNLNEKYILINNFEIRNSSESSEEQYSSEGEQLDNLVEVAVSQLETLEKTREKLISNSEEWKNPIKTFTVLNDDIFEENFDISLSTNENELNKTEESNVIPEKYETEEIFDDILLESLSTTNEQEFINNESEKIHSPENDNEILSMDEEKEKDARIDDHQNINEYYINEKHPSDDSSESSESDINKDISESIITSPRDKDDSRLEIDNLNDDLLSSISIDKNLESKADYPVTPIITNTEKEIMATIDKLKGEYLFKFF